MTGRERLVSALNHIQPDRPPVDLGACGQTGISASTMYRLRKALGLPQKPVKVIEPFQMLGAIDKDLRQALGIDIIGLWNSGTLLGYKNENWKPWTMCDGTPVLMAGGFECDLDEKGDVWVYPGGNRKAKYSLHMPNNGFFFDNIMRSSGFDEDKLTPLDDFKDDFSVANDEDARYWEEISIKLFEETDYGILGNLGGAGLGDVALIPGPFLENPKGIRSIEDWLMAHIMYPDYIKEVFEYQTGIVLKNLEIYKQAVGGRIQAIWLSGTDFGTQTSCFTSIEVFRNLYKPFFKKINDWVHKNTTWKTFYHTCGAIEPLINDMIEMGVDILNPVQCSAKGMDPGELKIKYGKRLVFWGGGVDTQKVLPYGTAEEVASQVKERVNIFSEGGGYVFASIHNIVAKVPAENIIAMFKAFGNLVN
ncbi:MAG: methyltransferase [Treponema sp.]|nr:methyltransferase [Treponema sp.]